MKKYILLLLICFGAFAQDSLTVVAVGDAEVVTEKILVEKDLLIRCFPYDSENDIRGVLSLLQLTVRNDPERYNDYDDYKNKITDYNQI